MPPRATWGSLPDADLLGQCEVDTYRASGPGGQKRNKTSSAVRLRHAPTGLLVIAEESRSQHENKAKALKRIRAAIYLHLRDPVPPGHLDPGGLAGHPELAPALLDGRLAAGAKHPAFWLAAGVVLDALAAAGGQVSVAAAAVGVSTGNLVEFLQTSPKVWQEANRVRIQCGRKLLKPS